MRSSFNRAVSRPRPRHNETHGQDSSRLRHAQVPAAGPVLPPALPDYSAPGDETPNDYDACNDEEEMNQASADVEDPEAQDPGDHENDR
jgi:hypothetical protein